MNKSIWHTYDIENQPAPETDVIVYVKKNNGAPLEGYHIVITDELNEHNIIESCTVWSFAGSRNGEIKMDLVTKWAYLSDLENV